MWGTFTQPATSDLIFFNMDVIIFLQSKYILIFELKQQENLKYNNTA